jgi:hypothetical protein
MPGSYLSKKLGAAEVPKKSESSGDSLRIMKLSKESLTTPSSSMKATESKVVHRSAGKKNRS